MKWDEVMELCDNVPGGPEHCMIDLPDLWKHYVTMPLYRELATVYPDRFYYEKHGDTVDYGGRGACDLTVTESLKMIRCLLDCRERHIKVLIGGCGFMLLRVRLRNIIDKIKAVCEREISDVEALSGALWIVEMEEK